LGQEDAKDKKSPRYVKLPEKKFLGICAGETFTAALGSTPLDFFIAVPGYDFYFCSC
jgi:hypothetical protein